MAQANFGVVGMAVMGKNLALNVESRGYTVAIYNRTTSKTEEVYKEHQDKNLVLTKTLEEFVEKIKKQGINVGTGKFGAHMMVNLTNDGPVTILLESRKEF